MKKILKKMWFVILWGFVVIAMIAIGYSLMVLIERNNTVEYHAPETVLEEVQELITPQNDVQVARDMLAEATAKLDAEEARLTTEINEREAKIAEINEIRASF